MKPFNEESLPRTELKVGDIVTHGDVVIERIERPEDFDRLKKNKDSALAYGEATGHVHLLEGGHVTVKIDPKETLGKVFEVLKETTLKHQEHKQIKIPPGIYRSRIQKEYDPFSKKLRQVAD